MLKMSAGRLYSAIQIFVCVFSAVCVPVMASAQGKLDLDTVVRSVHQHFPLILATEEERSIAEGQVLAALGEFDTRWKSKVGVTSPGYYQRQIVDAVMEKPLSWSGVDLYAGYRLGRGEFATYEGKAVTGDAGEARAGIQLPLLRNREIDSRRAGLALAHQGVGIADQKVIAKKIEAVYKAKTAYWRWVGAGQKRKIARRLLDTARDRDHGLKRRVELGDIAEFEWVDNQRGVLQRESQLQAAERAVAQATYELSLYLRDEQGTVVQPGEARLPAKLEFPSSVKDLALEQLENLAFQNRPELQTMIHERRQAEIKDQHARNQLLPALDLMLEFSKDGGQVDRTREPAELVSGFILEVPLERRKARGESEIAQAKMRKLDREIEYMKQAIITEIQDAHSALSIASQQVRIVDKELEYARKLEEGERIRFGAGESTIFMVNQREQATADADLRKVDSLVYAHSAEAMMQAALGKS